MTDNKKFRTVSHATETVLTVDEIRQELVDEGRANGSIGVDKISLAEVFAVAVDFYKKRRKKSNQCSCDCEGCLK